MTTRKVIDLAQAREVREREKRTERFMKTLGDVWVVRVEKKRLPEGLKAKCDSILACPYEDLKQSLEDFLDVLLSLRFERDDEDPEAS